MAQEETLNVKLLQDIFENYVLFYTDESNDTEVYVEYYNEREVLVFEPISSKHFDAFVSCFYMDEANTLIPPNYKNILQGYVKRVINEKRNPVSIQHRLCGSIHNGSIAYSLANCDRNVVVVKKSSWEIGDAENIKFLHSPVEKAQVIPKGGGDLINLLRPFVNLPDDDYLLLLVALVQSFSRVSSHFAIIFSSEKGTGKSTLTQVIRYLIDPSESALMLTSTMESDLKTALANSYVACFDNTEVMNAKFSDILCAAVTGTKEVKRKLYTNADQVVLSLHNLLILNGIDIVPHKSDLAERSLYFSLKKIDPENRIPDSEFWDNFYAARPKIMGAIFDTLSKAMELYPSVQTTKLHRMADAHKEMLAIALALGISEDEFNRILDENKAHLENTYAEKSVFVSSISDYFFQNGPITGQASTVYEEVHSYVGNIKSFPNSASAFTRKLEEERDALNRMGIDFTKTRDTTNGNRCKLAIHKKGVTPSMAQKKSSLRNQPKKQISILCDDEDED